MVHYSRLSKIVIDVPPAGHDRELAFWSAAVGQQLAQGATVTPNTMAPRCTAGNSDCSSSGSATARAGCTSTSTPTTWPPNSPGWKDSAPRVQAVHSWWILRDPAGLLFCVVPEPAGSLSDSNAQRWD